MTRPTTWLFIVLTSVAVARAVPAQVTTAATSG